MQPTTHPDSDRILSELARAIHTNPGLAVSLAYAMKFSIDGGREPQWAGDPVIARQVRYYVLGIIAGLDLAHDAIVQRDRSAQ